jgi:ankyrin repeat protein
MAKFSCTRQWLPSIITVASLFLSAPAWTQTLPQLVEEQDFEAALAMVNAGADANALSPDGTSALHWAVYWGNQALVERLLRAEANPDTRNDYGSSPMMEAATVGNTGMLALLLDAGADVESPNAERQTALMAVARTGNLDAARLLLEHGADVNAVELWGGQTALMWAAARRHPDMVKLLVEQGAEVDTRAIDRDWERRITAEPRVKDMWTGGFTALLYAVREDCIECVAALLDSGADINRPDPDNVSPLLLSLINMRFDIARLLIERGADINQWDFWGRTPLYAAIDLNILPNSNRGDLPPVQNTTGLQIATMLLERGADPDYALKLSPPAREIVYDRGGDYGVMTTGSSPLQRAAYGADIDAMALLLQYGARVELANINGVDPLVALMNNGGTRNRNKTEATVIAGLRLLMEAGVDINSKGGRGGESPLHAAARQDWQEVVKFLAANGADLDAVDANGLTPLDRAMGRTGRGDEVSTDIAAALADMAALLTRLKDNPDLI